MGNLIKTIHLYGEPANIYDFLIRLRKHDPNFPKRRFTFAMALMTETRIVLAILDWEGKNSEVACLEIIARPNNITIVDCIDGYDPFHNYDNRPIGQGFCDLIEWFEEECFKAGLVVPTQQEDKTTKKRGGRPRNKDDEWAYRQVREENRAPTEVYQEWLKRIGSRAEYLADKHESFTKAIKPREKTEKTD